MQRVLEHIDKGIKRNAQGDACRLFHGRGHCYPGLSYINVDWFSPILLITLYQQPEDSEWQALVEQLESNRGGIDTALVQRRYQKGAPIEVLWGEFPSSAFAQESGLKFCLSFGQKQNFGFFLDMSPGRLWLRERADNKRVLNLFAYTCSFSVFAIEGGAHSVVNVDMSGAALKVGRENHRLNGHDDRLKRDIEFLPYNLFRSWGKVKRKGPYDLIVIDPPSRQAGSFVATQDYAKVIRRLPELLSEQGEVLACLNAPELGEEFLTHLIGEYCPQLELVSRLENRKDFPEQTPSKSLKMLHYRFT